ncbi:MAG TPA: hypothetical protein PKJ93_00055, partial [Methanoculleus sp.]|nr:hypothetical protein [Methanoculleus sp.]
MPDGADAVYVVGEYHFDDIGPEDIVLDIGPVNTMAQGHPVPVGYGEMIVGSAVISAGIEIDEVAV